MQNIAQDTWRLLIRTLAFAKAAKLVTGGPPPNGSGHEGPRRSCRAPPSAGSTWAVAHRAGPRPLAKHASSGTPGHTATSRGPSLQGAPAWSSFRCPSFASGLRWVLVGVPQMRLNTESNDILPAGKTWVNGQIAP